MSTPQPGVFIEGTTAHHHLELALAQGASDAAVRCGLRALLDAADEAGTRDGVHTVIGLGPVLWQRLAASGAPSNLRTFAVVGTPDHGVPTTQRDLWVWVHGGAAGIVLDAARGAAWALAPVASVVLEQPGWTYRDLRDLIGFQDGTENPAPLSSPMVSPGLPAPMRSPCVGSTISLRGRSSPSLNRNASSGARSPTALISAMRSAPQQRT